MQIAVLGAAGQLGTELCLQLGDRALPWTRADVDLTNPDSVRAALTSFTGTCVINAAAYNKVDIAEEEPQVAYAVNALGPRLLAQECADRDLALVHVSTDYVFGLEADRTNPFTELDAPGPVSCYGQSKLAGEYFVRSICPRHFVVRTCGLYGLAALQGAGKGNFVETMLRLGNERDELRVVNDQHCTPTSVKDLAAAILSLVETEKYGLYHAVNSGATTWAEFAAHIFDAAGMTTRVTGIPSSEYPTKARRPGYSVLNCDKLEQTIGRPMPTWQDALREYLSSR
ncbi:MAG: dTDP-4-dehydrorhamnose reductase [Planctomycetaceae bacterium]|nr:dTDP-4-dehydrorhamnose reductase [Planctomycetaceae bacterium]